MLDKGRSHGYPHVPYLRNINVQWGRVDTSDLLMMELANDDRERFGVRKGDLLVCEGGEPGRAAIWDRDGDYIAYQKALHRVRPGDEADSRFLMYAFEQAVRTGALDPFTTGSTIAHLPQRNLRRLPLALPSMAEQRRIVEILDDHLSRLDAAAKALDLVSRRIGVYVEAIVLNAPELVGAQVRYLADLISQPLANGRSVPTAAEGFPVLRLTALRDGEIDLEEQKIGRWSRQDAAPFLVARDDVLVARGNGSLRLVGRAALVSHDPLPPVAFPDTMIRIRHDPGVVRADYLTTMWNSRIVRRQIEAKARTTAGIYKVNQHDLNGVSIPVPCLPDQASLVDRLADSAEGMRTVSGAVSASIRRTNALKHALLATAFSGQLIGASSDIDRVEELISV
jgi:type I restriction enzyme S subunit